MITPAQCRAARGWLNITQAELALLVGCSVGTIVDFERGKRHTLYAHRIMIALEESGIRFISDRYGSAKGIEDAAFPDVHP